MLPKKYRLTWVQFYKNPHPSRKLVSSYLTVFIKRSGTKFPRFAITVGKFLDKRSSYRHVIKRLIVEGIRASLTKIKQPIDVLIKAKKIIKRNELETLRKEINYLLRSVNV